MVATRSSETSVDLQRTTRRYIPEDGTLNNHRCEKLKSKISALKNGQTDHTMPKCQCPMQQGKQTSLMHYCRHVTVMTYGCFLPDHAKRPAIQSS
jgi:hypothetical protein